MYGSSRGRRKEEVCQVLVGEQRLGCVQAGGFDSILGQEGLHVAWVDWE